MGKERRARALAGKDDMSQCVYVADREAAAARAQPAYMMLAALSLINLFNFMDRMLFSVLLEPMKRDLMLSDTQMGVLGGVAFALLFGAAGLVMGRLADTRNRVRTIATVLGLWSVASALCSQAQGFAHMFLARAGVGVGTSGCSPCAHSLIADSFPPERRSLALSIFTGVGTLGTLLGLVLGGLIAEAHGWRAAFLAFAVPGILFAPCMFFLSKEPKRGTFDRAPIMRTDWLSSLRLVLRKPTARLLVLALPLLMLTAGVGTWIPAFLQRAHDATAGDVGAYGGASIGLGLVTGTVIGGVLVDALRQRNALWEFWWPALATALSVPLLALFYLADSTMLAYVALFMAFFVAGSSFGPGLACMLVVAEPSARGTMVALTVLCTSLIAYGFGPTFVGLFSDYLITHGFGEENGESLRYALLAALAFPAIGSALFLAAARTAASDSI